MRVVFLAGAEEDLKEIRRYVLRKFGKPAWLDTSRKIQASVRIIQTFPESGSAPEELAGLGPARFRQLIPGQNRLIDEVGEGIAYIHVVCDTRRDLRSVLARRVLRVSR